MKNFKKYIILTVCTFLAITLISNAQIPFPQAIATCEDYEQKGIIKHKGEPFNLQITLKKAKGNKCIYKEKIYQDIGHQTLTCEFNKNQLGFISESMQRFNNEFGSEIAKNKIFEAKLTTNAEVFQKYLVDQNYCSISYSNKKN